MDSRICQNTEHVEHITLTCVKHPEKEIVDKEYRLYWCPIDLLQK